ncbi:MAG: helix-turn-helix domain-containing protein [bacterium]|nr:helix-turn-helix domain-containing protein [bacterium]
MPNYASSLSELGLSQQETVVYLATLELGASSISDIAKKAGIKRPTAYYVIDGLMNKNLISKAPRGKRILYIAEPPSRLLANLRVQEEKLINVLPRLESLQNSAGNKPKVRFYEGREGIGALYTEIFKTHKKILAMGSLQNVSEIFPYEETATWFRFLRDHGGKIYDLLDSSEDAKKYAKAAYRKGLGPIKYLPADFKMGTDMLIVDDQVLLISYSSMIGVLIENADIAQTQRQAFEFMWKHL